ncbi:MAG: D-alanyl-D-alanine carboxypeptidase/D-alanyl-D-alanine-endopeptidase [Planctomycetota bacterium]
MFLHAALFLLLAGDVASDLQGALQRAGIARDGLGVLVGEAGGRTLLAVSPDTPRIPASNQKVVTAALALDRLGHEFRFRTRFGRAPDGTLVVVGDGDPNFSGRFFEGDPTRVLRAIARDLKKRGVARVENGILLDVSRFDDEVRHPDWPADQLDKWYCAPVAALVYNDSCHDIIVQPGPRAGGPAVVRVEPGLAPTPLVNASITVSDRSRHVLRLRWVEDRLRVEGGVWTGSSGFKNHFAVRDPALFFGASLKGALVAEGVPVEGNVRKGRATEGEEIVVFRTDLARTLKVMLTNSQNLYAECLFKRAGGGSFAAAGDAVRKLPGLENVVARDGSGMSRGNLISPRALYAVLQRLRDDEMFVQALAAGGEGTLRKRYRDLGVRLRAKTGYIRGVSTLSGYVTSAGGKRYVFAILCNGKAMGRARRLQDLVVQTLARAR